MKNIFLATFLLMVSLQVLADEANKCDRPKAAEINGSDEDKEFPGTNDFGKCEKLSLRKFSSIYPKGQSRDSGFNWKPYVEFACCDKDKYKDKYETQPKCLEGTEKLAKKCESVAYLIHQYGRDWTSEDQLKPADSQSVVAAPNGNTPATAVMSPIKCKSAGIETLDYEACKKFQEQLQLIEGIQQVTYGVQETVYQNKMVDAGAKHASDDNAATGALKVTGESLKMQQDMYQQRVAVDATKYAYLQNIYNDMPKSEDIAKKCDDIDSASKDSGLTITSEECRAAARVGSSHFGLAINQDQIQTMKSQLIKIATAAGGSLVLANLTGKRANDVDKAIAKIEAFKPIDPFIVSEEDATSTFCKQNPGLPQCLPGDLTRSFDALNDNIITFGEGGKGANYVTGNSVNDVAGLGGSDSSSGTGSTPKTVGSVIADAVKDNSMEGSTGATITNGGVGGAAPGGGGGSASAGTPGGGGGAAPAGAAAGAAAIAGKAPTYAGGGSFSVMGGLGINRAKGTGKAEDNPFGKLFGKDTPKNNGVINFREIASQKVGDKADNIFEMISKRYTSVNADKRLLEYELTK